MFRIMSDALRIAWQRPARGFRLCRSRRHAKHTTGLALGPKELSARAFDKAVPVNLSPKEQGRFQRAFERLATRAPRGARSDAKALEKFEKGLLAFAEEWGCYWIGSKLPWYGGPFGVDAVPESTEDLLDSNGNPLPTKGVRVTVPTEPVEEVRAELVAYAETLEALAKLPERSDEARDLKLAPLRQTVAEKLTQFGVADIDSDTLAWVVRSPLALAWQQLREMMLGAAAHPRFCEHCKHVFMPKATDWRARRSPPAYCGETCRANAARRRLRRTGKPRRSGRPSRPGRFKSAKRGTAPHGGNHGET